jgi:hypothetical protein
MSEKRAKLRHLFKASARIGDGGNVVLNFTGRPKAELAHVGDAYYRGARSLLDAMGADRAYSDFDAYPIVFLCRHALELLIKAVLTLGNEIGSLLGDPSLKVEDLYADHSLGKRIPQLKRVFSAVGWEDAFEQAGMAKGEFEKIIEEFEAYDAGSFTFRYPLKKDGGPSLKESHFVFSPKQFLDTLDPILTSLSGACSGLEEYKQMMADGAAEAASYDDHHHEDCYDENYYDEASSYEDYYSE